jgi:hypothetical protein
MVGLAGILVGLGMATGAFAQAVEITKDDLTKQKSIDASQVSVLGVRLGTGKDQALAVLQRLSSIKVQDEAAAGRVYVISPADSKNVVMSLRVVENLVTTINLVGGFGEWLQGDTRLLFRAFEDDSLRHRFLGREDQREVVRGGTKEAPTMDVTYAYYKEGLLLHSSMRQSPDGKQVEVRRELVLLFPARTR